MKSNARATVGVIGFGYWGPKLVRNLFEMPSVDLRWVADLHPARLVRVEEHYPTIRATGDYRDVLASDVDAVVIATPVRTHYQLVKDALLAGKHVMVEKPLTASGLEGKEIVELADRLGLTLMVGHTFVYNVAVRKLRAIVQSGELGEIYYVDTTRLNLDLFRFDVNVLWDLAPHDLSILLFVLDRDPVAVSARGSANVTPGIHDVAYVEVRFPGDVIAHVHVSWLDPCKVRQVTIVGSRKMVVYNDLEEVEKIRLYDKGVEKPYETDRFSDFPLTYRYGDVTIPHLPVEEPLRTQCEHFVHCIRTSSRPDSSGYDGLKVVRILEKADRSLRNGGVREPIELGSGPGNGVNGEGSDPGSLMAPGVTAVSG